MKLYIRILTLLAMVLTGCFVSGVSRAGTIEFKNIGDNPVILFDAPSVRGQKLFVAPRGMPVEVVINYGNWSKIRDVVGDLSWVETRQLVAQHAILVRSLNAKVYAQAAESSDVVFSADKGVLLDSISPPQDGWVKVKHRDGEIGYIRISDVWGI